MSARLRRAGRRADSEGLCVCGGGRRHKTARSAGGCGRGTGKVQMHTLLSHWGKFGRVVANGGRTSDGTGDRAIAESVGSGIGVLQVAGRCCKWDFAKIVR